MGNLVSRLVIPITHISALAFALIDLLTTSS